MTAPKKRPLPPVRRDYPRFFAMETRWNDMDLYGHVNNVVYLEYFDSALNRALIEADALDLLGETGPIGLVASNSTDYFSELSYPATLTIGVRVERIGTTSLNWGFAVFRGDEEIAAAKGVYVHVYVDRLTRKPVPLTPALRAVADRLLTPAAQ